MIGITSPYPRENIIAGNYILADMQAYLDKRHRQQNKEILIRHSPGIGECFFAADGRVYFRSSEVRIELYTDRKDPGAEALVETVLDDAGIFYNKSEVWIQSEKLYEVLYSMEL